MKLIKSATGSPFKFHLNKDANFVFDEVGTPVQNDYAILLEKRLGSGISIEDYVEPVQEETSTEPEQEETPAEPTEPTVPSGKKGKKS